MPELNPFSLIMGFLGSIIQPASSYAEKVYEVEPAVEVVAESAIELTKDTNDNNDNVIETYTTSSNNNCKIHNSYPKSNETVTWSGNCKDGYADGEGVTTWYVDGTVSQTVNGNLIKGKLNGFITANLKHGDYNGKMINSKYHGFGVRTWKSGSSYSGNWKDNRRNGYGILTIPTTDKEAITYWDSPNQGKYVGDTYILEGIFENGYLAIECQKSDCPSEYMK